MAGINKVIIIGRLGNDPEVRYTPSGSAVAKFSVATSDEWKDKNSGEKKERGRGDPAPRRRHGNHQRQ